MTARQNRLKRVQPAAEMTPNTKVPFQDKFQAEGAKRIEEIAKRVEGKGRNLLYGLLALLALGILIAVFVSYNRRASGEAQAALGKAIKTSEASINESPAAGSTEKTFKTEKERAEAAVAEFNSVAEKFGGAVGEKAKYFAAVNRLTIDRAAGIAELETLSQSNSDVGTLAKFALAQTKVADGKQDEAATLFSELSQMSDPVISKATVNFELAKVYEAQGKKDDAVNLYFQIADDATKAKDLDGNPVPLSATASDAKKKLQALDPAKAEEIKTASETAE
jgi:predicted negative regulator of RcsB-dependent stress response